MLIKMYNRKLECRYILQHEILHIQHDEFK